MVEASPSGDDFTIIRYAAMVARNAVSNWHSRCEEHTTDEKIEQNIRELMEGVEAVTGIKPANSKHVSCTDEEMRLKAVWMSHKNMDVSRVATDLRWFSTAPRLEIERVFRLQADRRYLIQLNVPQI
jgi:hypothetical protein